MKAFGYSNRDKECNELLNLKEITLDCNKDDLHKIIEFLKSVCNDIEKKSAEDGAHWHYRDYNELWSDKQSDLIIYLNKSITS